MDIKASLLALWLLVLLCISATASPQVYNYSIKYFVDESGKVSVDSILSSEERLNKSETSILNFSYESKPVWILVEKDQLTDKSFVCIENTHIDSATFFHIRNGRITRQNTQGDRVNFSNRYVPIPRINEKIFADTDSLLIRIKSEGPLLVPVRLFTNEEIFPNYQSQQNLHFIYFGIVLLAFIVNFCFYLRLKENNFIYYSMCLFSFVLVILMENGYLFQYLWPSTPIINGFTPTIYSLSVFILFFMERFLKIRESSRTLFLFFILFYLYHGSIVIVNLTGYFNAASKMYLVFWLIFPAFIFCVSLYYYFKKGIREARYLLFAWTSLLLAIVVYILSLIHILPYNFLTSNILPVASALEVIFLFLAVGHRFELLKKEKEYILASQNKILEEKLSRRTKEITIKSYELQAQNVQLRLLKEELQHQRDVLARKNVIIEEKNAILHNRQINLEEIVSLKTEAVLKANKELEDRNKRLQQFTYIAAHNLRGPVATLRGLHNIFNFSNPADEHNLFLLEQFGKTTEKLDDVIKELTFLLDLNKNSEQLKEYININKVVDNVKQLLSKEIEDKNAEVTLDSTGLCEFISIPVYINNMFYNLIGNALKYSSARKKPVVRISCLESPEEVTIKIEDNGRGINLNKYGEKLFLPFQRFLPDVDGKGLGLFITREQVESMGGKIFVTSSPGEGTCFTIILPKSTNDLHSQPIADIV